LIKKRQSALSMGTVPWSDHFLKIMMEGKDLSAFSSEEEFPH
jgi:hypothetical protein